MTSLKNSFYGILIITGLLMVGCDTETPDQLLCAILFGFGLMFIGGRGLIKNDKE